MIRRLLRKLFRHSTRSLKVTGIEWFQVSFDDEHVYLSARPPGHPAWSQEFRWDDITRVCFKQEDMWTSDAIYVFTSTRPESYAVPTEAKGGSDFWEEILRRKFFDPKLAIRAAHSQDGLYCWPPSDDSRANT